MRIINQAGTYSIEFENHDIRVSDGIIFAVTPTRDIVMAKYESEVRAEMVFKELHEAAEREMMYLPDLKIYKLPKE